MMNDKGVYDVIIVGAGPAGLSMAIALKELKVSRVALIEREKELGGTPRHCGHSWFGMREYKRLYRGRAYAKRLTNIAKQKGVDIYRQTTVMDIENITDESHSLKVIISHDEGMQSLFSRRIVLATGIRETPRSARLVSGIRSRSISTTGALQSMIYSNSIPSFKKAVVIGSELVSFSALLTMKHAKIKPIMMIEQNTRITSFAISHYLAKWLKVPIVLNTKLIDIIGDNGFVTGVRIKNIVNNTEQEVACDGVVFTGQFVPETSLINRAKLIVDKHSKGPEVNQFGQSSNKKIYVCGNLLRGVETAGWCWQEGHDLANIVHHDLTNDEESHDDEIAIRFNQKVIKYVVPQKLRVTETIESNNRHATLIPKGMANNQFQVRVKQAINGIMMLKINGNIIWQRKIKSLPERRILVPMNVIKNLQVNDHIELDMVHFE